MQLITLALAVFVALEAASEPYTWCASSVGQSCTDNTCCSTDGDWNNAFLWCIGEQFNPTPYTCPSGVCETVNNTAQCLQPLCDWYLCQSCTTDICCSNDGGNSSNAFLSCSNGWYDASAETCVSGECAAEGQSSTTQCLQPQCDSYSGQSCTGN
jgi:hypothetical protein